MSNLVKEFNDYRSKMNEKLLADNNKIVKRIFNLDTNAYAEGALDVKTKELLGLVASTVLRCDDCVKYHLGKCKEIGFSKEEVYEAMGVASLIDQRGLGRAWLREHDLVQRPIEVPIEAGADLVEGAAELRIGSMQLAAHADALAALTREQDRQARAVSREGFDDRVGRILRPLLTSLCTAVRCRIPPRLSGKPYSRVRVEISPNKGRSRWPNLAAEEHVICPRPSA